MKNTTVSITICLLLLSMVGASAEVTLANKVVTAVFSDRFYIEETDYSAGIAVKWVGEMPAGVREGAFVTIVGELQTLPGGERYIASTEILITGGYAYRPPSLARGVGMKNVLVGGGSLGAFTTGVQGGFGLNNIGLLVTSWGRVSDIGESSFVINDGSLQGGIKIDATSFTKPTLGSFVTVTGISSIDPESCDRLIKPRGQTDIVVVE